MIMTIILLVIAGFCLFKIGELNSEKRILQYIRKEILVPEFKPDWEFLNRLIDHI